MSHNPRISIIIPAYESHATLENCLRCIQSQDMRDFEVIVIDSSPSDQYGRIVDKDFPWVRYEHVEARMLPHEARNYGVTKSSAELLIFSDPDIYPPVNWIRQLLEAHRIYGDMVVGAVSCYGERWLDLGTHISKFDLWLPGGPARPIDIAPTMNLLCPRSIFDKVGGFPGERMIGDTIFSWDVAAAGYRIHFAPGAEVDHHHVSNWVGLLRERYTRGREFGYVRAERKRWSRTRILLHLILTITPLRWMKLVMRTLQNARSANLLARALWTLPISMSAQAAWLMGETRGFIDLLSNQRST